MPIYSYSCRIIALFSSRNFLSSVLSTALVVGSCNPASFRCSTKILLSSWSTAAASVAYFPLNFFTPFTVWMGLIVLFIYLFHLLSWPTKEMLADRYLANYLSRLPHTHTKVFTILRASYLTPPPPTFQINTRLMVWLKLNTSFCCQCQFFFFGSPPRHKLVILQNSPASAAWSVSKLTLEKEKKVDDIKRTTCFYIPRRC